VNEEDAMAEHDGRTAGDRPPDTPVSDALPVRIVIVAGEHSGDALGAKLMAALDARLGGRVTYAGIGGHLMEARGFRSDFPLSDIAVMGPFAILKRLPTLVRRVHRTVEVALDAEPDVVVIVDAPEFTHPVAKRIRKRRPEIPIVDYVSPTVWAWRPGRARTMRPYVDHVLALLPFEPAAHAELGGPPCTYVGHPLTERLPMLAALDPGPVLAAAGLDPARPIVMVLPGSRRSEVGRLTDVFGAALARVAPTADPATQYVIPALPHVRGMIDAAVAAWPADAPRPVPIAGEDEATKFAAFKAARAALAASGTVTLELAMTRTPMVVAYRVDVVISMLRHLIRTRTSVLPNLILGELAIPEFHQERCTPDNLATALAPLLADGPERAAQLAALDRVPRALAPPAGRSPSEAAAAVVVGMLPPHLRDTC
jgi:lipid-A-disaccharide synthase